MSDQNLMDPAHPSGPVKVGKLTVKVDRDICIGAATCVAIAIKTFALDTNAKSTILNTAEEDNEEAIAEAARSCPTAAISIVNEKGEKVFPK